MRGIVNEELGITEDEPVALKLFLANDWLFLEQAIIDPLLRYYRDVVFESLWRVVGSKFRDHYGDHILLLLWIDQLGWWICDYFEIRVWNLREENLT